MYFGWQKPESQQEKPFDLFLVFTISVTGDTDMIMTCFMNLNRLSYCLQRPASCHTHLMFCRMHPLDPAVRHDRGEPTVAISRNSLNVRTPMGNLRALAAAAMKEAAD